MVNCMDGDGHLRYTVHLFVRREHMNIRTYIYFVPAEHSAV